MSALESAKQYIDLGWRVHPVRRDKTPLLKGWPAKATTDESQVAAWWSGNGHLGIGIVTGASSDLVVLDIDPRHNGNESLRELEQQCGTLPVTVTCKTGGGDRQFYFRYPQGIVIKNKTKVGGLNGVDVRGEGGYVIAPPSMHPSGGRYEWISETYELANLPSAWISLLQQQPMADTPTATPNGDGQLRQSTLQFIANGAAEGERNSRLFEAAAELAGTGFDRSVAEAMLTQGAARCVPPLDDVEAAKTIKSAFSRPRTPFIEDDGELGWVPAGGAENNSVNSVTRSSAPSRLD